MHLQNPTPREEEPALSLETREQSASPSASHGISAYVGPASGSMQETPANVGSFQRTIPATMRHLVAVESAKCTGLTTARERVRTRNEVLSQILD